MECEFLEGQLKEQLRAVQGRDTLMMCAQLVTPIRREQTPAEFFRPDGFSR